MATSKGYSFSTVGTDTMNNCVTITLSPELDAVLLNLLQNDPYWSMQPIMIKYGGRVVMMSGTQPGDTPFDYLPYLLAGGALVLCGGVVLLVRKRK